MVHSLKIFPTNSGEMVMMSHEEGKEKKKGRLITISMKNKQTLTGEKLMHPK